MILYPANHTSKITRELGELYPERIGIMNTPGSWKTPTGHYCLDNGCFKRFDEAAFFSMLEKAKGFHAPKFVACPDVVGCHDRTVALWGFYSRRVMEYGFPVAFVAQDGCTPSAIPTDADWIFVGGGDPWKSDNIHRFVGLGLPVHVGRINTKNNLEYCERLGVDSVDGTGWMRARGKQFNDMMDWFSRNQRQGVLFT